MAKQREPRAAGAGPGPPQSADEALARARAHGRAAAAETLAALHALLDAASLTTAGAPAAGHPLLGRAARVLEGLVAELSPADAGATSLLAAVAEALDLEIARWEQRARQDPDARAVLRAFLGLRELLWELGVRAGARPEPEAEAPPRPRSRGPRPRVQRVRVEG